MKTGKELAIYANTNLGSMRTWLNKELKHVENVLDNWINEFHIKDKKENEIVSDVAMYDLDGNVITYNFMLSLQACNEEYTNDTVTEAIDIIFKDISASLTDHIRRSYPCLKSTHSVVMRANNLGECIMYIGPYGFMSQTAHNLFDDYGVFMTQGMEACKPMFKNINFFN